MSRLVVLVPPSEAKTVGGTGPPWTPGAGAFPELDEAREAVLAAAGGGVADGPTTAAIERYDGVLYRALDWPSLPVGARRRGRGALLTVSGLWGLVAPADPIPHYKLKMSARLPELGRLSTFWRPRLTAALAPRLAGAVLWDLLPIEHAAAWDPAAALARRRITVRFVDRNGATVSHWNKLLKGALVREVLTHGIADPAALVGWTHPTGYRIDEPASTLRGRSPSLVFRELP